MPIYEYRCSGCGHELEVLQKLSEAPLSACPECGKPALTKLVSAAGFQLKGSGWYATDFKGSGTKPAAKAEAKEGSGAPKATEAKSESATESKSAAKGETTTTSGGSCGGNCSCH